MNHTFLSSAQGALVGLACGDAVGATLEFCPRHRIQRKLTDMIGGGKFRLQAGEWTDDTSMALCLAESLLVNNGFNLNNQMEYYIRWAFEGYNSAKSYGFGLGQTTVRSLGYFRRNGKLIEQETNSGNGALMRLAPVPIFYHFDLEQCLHYAELSTKTTHLSNDCFSANRYFAEVLFKIFNGETDKMKLFDRFQPYDWSENMQCFWDMLFTTKTEAEISSSGYVIHTLEAALWAFWNTESFKEAILKAANLGNDADTVAAVCGQIAGAFYGIENIPLNWREKLYRYQDIYQLATNLALRSEIKE